LPKVKTPNKSASRKKPKLPIKSAFAFFVALVLVFIIVPRLHTANTNISKNESNFNKTRYSTNDASSIWVVVNKGRELPASYVPSDLISPNIPLRLPATDPEMQVRTIVASSLQQMFKQASVQGIHLMLSSGYRSYGLQQTVYSGYVSTNGLQSTDSSSAKPGHSEHQTGLAIDIEPENRNCEVEICFADTSEGKWLVKNSYKYGFIIRYEKGKEKLTGYEYEPWHVRYVGNELADQIHGSNQTLEQFFNLQAYSTYVSNPYQLKDE
jgi:D-alanyl-D-alanine carboxypeptidase